MTEEDYIRQAKARNPGIFRAAEIRIKVATLEALLRHAYRAGEKSGESERGSKSVFEQMFGGKKF